MRLESRPAPGVTVEEVRDQTPASTLVLPERVRTTTEPPTRRRAGRAARRWTPSASSWELRKDVMTHFGLAIKNFVGPGEVPDVAGALRLRGARGGARLRVALGVGPRAPRRRAVLPDPRLHHHARRRRRAHARGSSSAPACSCCRCAIPTVAAKALGSLDVISSGRLILGVAAGWYAREFDAVGVPFKQRGRHFERNLDILMRLWTEDRVTLKVDEFNLREAVMVPRTAQRPRPPDPDRRLRRRGAQAGGHGGRRLAHLLLHAGELHAVVGQGEGLRRARRAATPRRSPRTNQLAIYVGRNREETTRRHAAVALDRVGRRGAGASRPSSTPSTAPPRSASSSSGARARRASTGSS